MLLNLIFNKIYFTTYCDYPVKWQIGFQDPATPAMEAIIYLHNYLCFFLVLVVTFVLWFLVKIIFSFNNKKNPTPQIFTHSSLLEIIWTIIPAVILLLIAVPSFALLYSIDDVPKPMFTVKIIGHQWYWTYEYSDMGVKFPRVSAKGGDTLQTTRIDNSYYELDTDGFLNLLNVDCRLILPAKTHVRLLITSADVLHSWTVPSFGIKVDACPGRLTQTFVYVKRGTFFFGQCSEICGVNHGFMPIGVIIVPDWVFFHIIYRVEAKTSTFLYNRLLKLSESL